jgi:hypothetical protein
MKLGATGLPSATRRSVSASAWRMNFSRASWRCAAFVQHRVQDREHAAVQALAAQLLDAGQRVAGLQQLDHLVEHARGRHVGQQRGHAQDRRLRVFGSISKPSLAAKRTTRMMRTGSSR